MVYRDSFFLITTLSCTFICEKNGAPRDLVTNTYRLYICVCVCVCIYIYMYVFTYTYLYIGFPGGVNAGDTSDEGLIPRSERSPRGGYGNPLQ